MQGVKAIAAIGVVLYLWVRGDIAWEPLRASLGRWEYFLPAFLLLAAMPVVQFWRWQSLLRANRLHLPHREVFSFLMVSKFFNMAFPGYISGDILRGFFVSRRAAETGPLREPQGQFRIPDSEFRMPVVPPTVAASIVLDRIAGLVPLFALCLIGLLGSLAYPIPRQVLASVGALASCGLLLPLLLFLLTYRGKQPTALLARLGRWPRLQEFLSAFYEGAHRYARNLKLIRNILAISFLNQGLAIASFVLFGWALQIQVPVMSYLMLVPLGILVTAIPVSPAGLGVGQVAFLGLFHLVGTAQGANLFTLYMASYVVINLAGALLYLFPLQGEIPPHPASAPKIQTE
ncbi:MAG: lysylphosphatidylglycerol synthase transmembrane domain-containing protein [Terriglobia bacterium]